MSYTPHVWETDYYIVKEDMNALSAAVGEAIMSEDALTTEEIDEICDELSS